MTARDAASSAATAVTTAPEWQVHLDLMSVDGWTDDQVAGVLEELADHGGALSGHPLAGAPGLIGVTLTVGVPDGEPIDLGQAISDATYAVLQAVGAAGAAVARLVAVEALTIEEADRRLAEPDTPDLVGVAEVADELGVTKQRVSELVRSPTSGTPEPLARLASGPVWERLSWRYFLESWTRRSGRPPARQATTTTAEDRALAVARLEDKRIAKSMRTAKTTARTATSGRYVGKKTAATSHKSTSAKLPAAKTTRKITGKSAGKKPGG